MAVARRTRDAVAVRKGTRERVTTAGIETVTTRAGITSQYPRGKGKAPIVDGPVPRPGVGGARAAGSIMTPERPVANPPVDDGGTGTGGGETGTTLGWGGYGVGWNPFGGLQKWLENGGWQQGVNSLLPAFLQPSFWIRVILFLGGITMIGTGALLFIRG